MLRAVALTGIAAVVAFALPNRAAAFPKYSHMHRAVYELEAAQKELRDADHDFDGNRNAARKAFEAAARQTKIALANAKDPYFQLNPQTAAYEKYKDYPHLRHALANMRDALQEMKKADHNFGGYGDKAQDALEAAILQAEKCLDSIR